jgi:hypothetical protein
MAVGAALAVGLILTLAALTAGCMKSESLVGTWTSEEQGETLEFRPDGSGALVTASGMVVALTWEVRGSDLILGLPGEGAMTVSHSIAEGILTLTSYGEEPATYTRVETTER